MEQGQSGVVESIEAVQDALQRVQDRLSEPQGDEESTTPAAVRMRRLLDVSHAMNSSLDISSVLDLAISTLVEVFGAERGFLLSAEADGDLAFSVAIDAKGGRIDDATSEVSRGVVDDVIASGQAVLVDDALEDERYKSRNSVLELDLRSAVCVPVRGREGILGAVYIDHRLATGRFGRQDVELLQMFANHLAVALENSQLFDELQQTNDELRQTQQMVLQEERLRALGTMASGIAHDLNNGLQPILGYSESLLALDHWDEATREQLEVIATSARDIAATVARFREFYRRRSGAEPLAPVDVHRLVQQTVELTAPRWRDMPQERGTVIQVRTDIPEPALFVLGIEGELREALTNEIINAVDAMPEGGEIVVGARREDRWVVLDVKDTGIGMTEDVRLRCLEPFFTTKGSAGTGMGLSVVYGIVSRHGGELEVQSSPGEGTCLTHRLPLAPDHPAPTADPVVLLPPLKILCVDDEQTVLDIVERALTAWGHHVTGVAGGQEALEALAADRFDLVITDLAMPGVDGRVVARTAKEHSGDTRVLMLTGFADSLEGAPAPGIDLVLAKPVGLSELQAAVVEVMLG